MFWLRNNIIFFNYTRLSGGLIYEFSVSKLAGLSLTWSQNENTDLKVIKLFSCLTQLSTAFQLLIKIKILTNEDVSCFMSPISDAVFIMLINVKMPTIVGILTFMSRIKFVLS